MRGLSVNRELCTAMVILRQVFGQVVFNVAARLVVPPPPPPTKTFGLNNLEPGAPLGGLAQDVGN